MNEPNNIYIFLTVWLMKWDWNHLPRHDCTVHQNASACLVIKVVRYHHPKIGDSPHMLLQNCVMHCHWLTQIFKWRCPMVNNFFYYEQSKSREIVITGNMLIYLPVPSFEHHSEGSMSNQVFSAVLKISHSLHCDGLMVQLMLGTDE